MLPVWDEQLMSPSVHSQSNVWRISLYDTQKLNQPKNTSVNKRSVLFWASPEVTSPHPVSYGSDLSTLDSGSSAQLSAPEHRSETGPT